MAILINRAASGLAAASYLFVAAINGGIYPLISIAVFLLLPLACIWFPEEMGSLAYVRSLLVKETSGCFVVAGGWLLLLLPVMVMLIGHFRSG